MNKHCHDDVVSELQIVANAENCIPKNQKIEEIEFTAKHEPKPATKKKVVS